MKAAQQDKPIKLVQDGNRAWWWYRDKYYSDDEGLSAEDVHALLLQRHRSRERKLERAHAEMRGEVGAAFRRERIPEAVRHEVWRRDQGRCVECGSRENLELDHIVPVSKGGSSTARNIELRCASCNARKSNGI